MILKAAVVVPAPIEPRSATASRHRIRKTGAMEPTTTNVEERDQWRARIRRALSDLQTHAAHIDARVPAPTQEKTSADPDSGI